ncbi:uncharacterized protein LOC144351274 [Saccoglossus kowalevskii]
MKYLLCIVFVCVLGSSATGLNEEDGEFEERGVRSALSNCPSCVACGGVCKLTGNCGDQWWSTRDELCQCEGNEVCCIPGLRCIEECGGECQDGPCDASQVELDCGCIDSNRRCCKWLVTDCEDADGCNGICRDECNANEEEETTECSCQAIEKKCCIPTIPRCIDATDDGGCGGSCSNQCGSNEVETDSCFCLNELKQCCIPSSVSESKLKSRSKSRSKSESRSRSSSKSGSNERYI